MLDATARLSGLRARSRRACPRSRSAYRELGPRHRATMVAVAQDAACRLPSEPLGSRHGARFNPRVAQVVPGSGSLLDERPSSDNEAWLCVGFRCLFQLLFLLVVTSTQLRVTLQ